MGPLLFLLILEIFGLYLLSKKLTNTLYRVFLMIFRHRRLALPILIVILFPGTVIHELSHLFTAEILGVKTGKLQLAPESIEGEGIQVGSVELVHTDPFRRSVIGLAPFFVGLTALFILSSLLPNLWNNSIIAYNQGILFSSLSLYYLLTTIYFLFAISNTMFSSKEDMKGVIPVALVLIAFAALISLVGFRVGITPELESSLHTLLKSLVTSLAVVIGINGILTLLTGVFTRNRMW